MGELSVRRNRGFAVPRYQKAGKSEKQTGSAAVRQTAARTDSRAAVTVAETLRQLMTQVNQVQRHIREGRRTLQSGEASLAEVQDNLGRMEELSRQAAEEGTIDRAALQTQLEALREAILRIVKSGVEAGLFRAEDADGSDQWIDTALDSLSRGEVRDLPAWLLRGMTAGAPDKAALLAALGMDGGASGPALLAALGSYPPEDSAASSYLATLYLGAVIAGGPPSEGADPAQAAEGLRQLMEAMADGASLDEAIEALTGGLFTDMEDFQAQFTGGTAPGLQQFLTDLLLSGEGLGLMPDASLFAMLAGSGDMDLLMGLLSALDGAGIGLMDLLDGAGSAESGALSAALLQPEAALSPEGGTTAAAAPPETEAFGTIQAAGQDLSGVELEPETGALTVDGEEALILRGLGRESPALRLIGEGEVTLQQVRTPLLTVEASQARMVMAGETRLAQLQLEEGSTLTLGGGGHLHIGRIAGGASGQLRLTGGAVTVEEAVAGRLPVVIDGPASLLAAGITVRNAQGEPLEPFDLLWKNLFPDWRALTALEVDGQQGRLHLTEEQSDALRLWLLKGNSSQGFPAHTVVFRGRDKMGRPHAGYVYLRWSQPEESFRPVEMYPNPFTVTGGQPEVDWRYEEESQTLRILSGAVTAISGGEGEDANQTPFSGRVALADGIGKIELTLAGVVCQVSSGGAFSLGRENEVTLLLQRGSHNIFESGAGCAGISLGDGTSLLIDQAEGDRSEPAGSVTAVGGTGGAGIGRDSGAGKTRSGAILIRGGAVNATGTGGGAGIGGALDGSAGDIRITGGVVSAQADSCAAAIGAGLQGRCGDIVITGSARVIKARGGSPGGDIGGCLFANCGRIQVSAEADIGKAKLWARQGLSLTGREDGVTLPQFHLSAQSLGLDGMDISTRETARNAMTVLAADRKRIDRLQSAYGVMYGQLEGSFGRRSGLYAGVVRNSRQAGTLLGDMLQALRRSPPESFSRWGAKDVGQLLR